MTISRNVINAYGENISCENESFKAFISPIEPKNAENKHLPFPAGVANEARYLLICADEISERSIVSTHDERYEVLRTEPIYFAGEISHYECVLRPKGRLSNV